MKFKLKIAGTNIKPLIHSLMQVDDNRLFFEAIQLLYDFKKYSSGVLLWLKKEYPNYMLICSALFGNIFEDRISIFQPEMKKVVDQYYRLINDVKEKNLRYYNDELCSSNLVLSAQPLQMLINQDIYIQKFHQDLENVLQNYTSIVKDYSKEVIPVLLDFTKEVLKFFIQNENSDLPGEGIELNLENIDNLEDISQYIRRISRIKAVKGIINIWKKTILKIRKVQDETLFLIPEVNEGFKNLIENFKKNVDHKSWIKLRLFQIERMDAFVIQFSKYIARLFHILTKDNKDYIPPYIRLKQRSEPRKELEPILNNEMKKQFPDLSEYLYSVLYYFKVRRNLTAHTLDPIIKERDSVIYVVDPESGEEIEFKIRDFEREIMAYSYFIEALGLPKE